MIPSRPRFKQTVSSRPWPDRSCRGIKKPIDTTCGVAHGITVIRAVLDTNVIVAALKSPRGASNEILRLADAGRFEIALTVPLFTEYEDVLLK